MLRIPTHKHDLEAAQAIVDTGMPEIEPLLPEVLEWLQDMNWPVARVLEKAFHGMGPVVVPHIRNIFQTDDAMWIYWMIDTVIPRLSQVAQNELRGDVTAFIDGPFPSWKDEEDFKDIQEVAQEYLESH
jgi:hypothetical protein